MVWIFILALSSMPLSLFVFEDAVENPRCGVSHFPLRMYLGLVLLVFVREKGSISLSLLALLISPLLSFSCCKVVKRVPAEEYLSGRIFLRHSGPSSCGGSAAAKARPAISSKLAAANSNAGPSSIPRTVKEMKVRPLGFDERKILSDGVENFFFSGVERAFFDEGKGCVH